VPLPQPKTFFIAQVLVHDPEVYEVYANGPHLEIWEKFSGQLVVIDEDAEIKEGSWPYTRTVIIEFPTKELARACYDSDEYQAIVGFRHKSATSNAVIVSGFPDAVIARLAS
jgi:uncharacterized protein (DUF1330 family)